jgi:hypothetical protein
MDVRPRAPIPDTDIARQRKVVDAFLAASRGGEPDALLPSLTLTLCCEWTAARMH